MKSMLTCVFVVFTVVLSTAQVRRDQSFTPLVSEEQPFQGGPVVKLDPAFDDVVPPNAKFEILKTPLFARNEGPVWINDGQYLLFSDMPANRIFKWTPEGDVSVFLDRSGYTGEPAKVRDAGQPIQYNGRWWVNLIGSNGLAIDAENRLIICARGDRALVRLEKDGRRTILADRFEGQRLNSPNDVIVKSDGSIYFTDLFSGTQPDAPPSALYRWHQGTLQLLRREYKAPGAANGLAFSPDEKFLYVDLPKQIMRFAVQPDGTLANEEIFVADTGATSMKVDQKGNLYFGGPDGLWIVSPAGKHLGTIPKPPNTNMAFGGADMRSLFLTTGEGLARIRLKIPGI